MMCCALFSSYVVFCRVLTLGKINCKFTDELKTKYLCLRNGREEWEAECWLCKPGTYVSVANKSALDLQAQVEFEKHKKAVRGCVMRIHITADDKVGSITSTSCHQPFQHLGGWRFWIIIWKHTLKKMHQPSTTPKPARCRQILKFLKSSNTVYWLLSTILQA